MNPSLQIALALWGFGMYWSLRYDHLMNDGFDWWGLRRAIALASVMAGTIGGMANHMAYRSLLESGMKEQECR